MSTSGVPESTAKKIRFGQFLTAALPMALSLVHMYINYTTTDAIGPTIDDTGTTDQVAGASGAGACDCTDQSTITTDTTDTVQEAARKQARSATALRAANLAYKQAKKAEKAAARNKQPGWFKSKQ